MDVCLSAKRYSIRNDQSAISLMIIGYYELGRKLKEVCLGPLTAEEEQSKVA